MTTNPEDSIAPRITELEVKLSLCEHQIEELNRTMFRQSQQIELLQGQLREIYRLVQTEGGAEPRSLRDEIPPHY